LEDVLAVINGPRHRVYRKGLAGKDGHLGCAASRRMPEIVTLESPELRQMTMLQKEVKILEERILRLLPMAIRHSGLTET
jgi:hypothetical protein